MHIHRTQIGGHHFTAPPAAKPRKMACPTSPAAPVTKTPGASGSRSWASDASSKLAVYFAESAACWGRLVRAICSSASGIEDPVAKFTFPVALGVPVRLHPLSAGWATPAASTVGTKPELRDADHNSNQHCKRKREKSRAEHHDRGWWEQEDSRQSNQEGNGVKPKAGQSPAAPQCSKNAVYGHESLIIGLPPAGSGRAGASTQCGIESPLIAR